MGVWGVEIECGLAMKSVANKTSGFPSIERSQSPSSVLSTASLTRPSTFSPHSRVTRDNHQNKGIRTRIISNLHITTHILLAVPKNAITDAIKLAQHDGLHNRHRNDGDEEKHEGGEEEDRERRRGAQHHGHGGGEVCVRRAAALWARATMVRGRVAALWIVVGDGKQSTVGVVVTWGRRRL